MSGLMNNFNLRFGNLGGFRGHTSTSGCPNTIVTQIHLYTESYMWCITGFTDLNQMLILRRFYVCTIGSN